MFKEIGELEAKIKELKVKLHNAEMLLKCVRDILRNTDILVKANKRLREEIEEKKEEGVKENGREKRKEG